MPEVIWKPNPGPQTWLLTCPIEDAFFGGQRGGGKTDALLGDWASHASDYAKDARGIIFRRTMPELEDVIKRSKELYIPLGCTWLEQRKIWEFPNGAELRMRYLDVDADADRYQGHAYTWIGFDEAGNWPNSAPIDKLRACMRSSNGVPCVIRLTGNPGGVGHAWLKARYIDVAPPLRPFKSGSITRVFIPSALSDNPKISNPDEYRARIKDSGIPEWLVKAWLEGDWSGPPVGGVINPDHLRTYDSLPLVANVCIAADLAYRVKQTADRSAIGAFGVTAADEVAFLPGMVIDRIDTLKSVDSILDLADQYGAQELYVGRDMITGSIGPFLNKRMQERSIWLTVQEVPNHQDQLLRSQSFLARTQQCKVLWPAGDQWTRVIRPELISYHGRGQQPDDIVAMAAHACMGLDMFSSYRAPKVPKIDNPDKKRWKMLDDRKNHGKTLAIKPLFGR